LPTPFFKELTMVRDDVKRCEYCDEIMYEEINGYHCYECDAPEEKEDEE